MVQETVVTFKPFSLHKPLCYLLSYSSCYFPYLHSSAKFTPLTSTPFAPLTSSSPIFHIHPFTSLNVSPQILSSFISFHQPLSLSLFLTLFALSMPLCISCSPSLSFHCSSFVSLYLSPTHLQLPLSHHYCLHLQLTFSH